MQTGAGTIKQYVNEMQAEISPAAPAPTTSIKSRVETIDTRIGLIHTQLITGGVATLKEILAEIHDQVKLPQGITATIRQIVRAIHDEMQTGAGTTTLKQYVNEMQAEISPAAP